MATTRLHKLWFYFRMGYAFYLAPLLSGANAIMLIYFVVGDKIAFFRTVFPHFVYFIFFAVLVGVPLFIFMGYLHYRRKGFNSEQEVLHLNNPYHFKLPDGFVKEINYPLQVELIDFLIEHDNGNDHDRIKRLTKLKDKSRHLISGGRTDEFQH